MDAVTPECWLPPHADTVVALAEATARPETFVWADRLRSDPGLVWFVLTHHADLSVERTSSLLREGIDAGAVVESVLHTRHGRLADWSRPAAEKALRFSQYLGLVAERLAGLVRLDPLLGHCLGQMTQLGSLVLGQLDTKTNGKDPSAHTRQLIRRVSCAAWLRELLLGWDLPSEVGKDLSSLQRWMLVLQAAYGLVTRAGSAQTGGQIAAQRLNILWDQEAEYASQLAARLPDPPGALSSTARQLLLRSLRLVDAQPAQTLSYTVKQLEAEVEDLRSRLARLQEVDGNLLREQKLTAVAELAAGAGHEINNPLAVISGQTQYLLKHEEDLDRAKSLQRIIGQTTRIHTLLRDLMFFARPPEPRYRTCQLGRMLKDAAKEVAELALQRGVKVELAPVAKTTLTTDSALVTTALSCLVRNGVEAVPAGGWVRVSATTQHGRVLVHVEDSGPGVPVAFRENVFDPFFSGRSAGRGVGLGLSKVWRVAQLHGGDVRLEQRPGQPTRFTLELPLRPARRQAVRLKRPA
jgi:two-component system, NtrC family, sensor kinase